MFYSHEVLTNRKYGVATVWLVATLGSKSSTKKVTRKAILGVNLRKACETIIEPDAPMALRLQSNLLYGVTRVYTQKWDYLLSDTQAILTSIRTFLNATKNDQIDKNSGIARPDQLMLADDPAFLVDGPFEPPPLDFDDILYEKDNHQASQSLFSISPRNISVSSGQKSTILGLDLPSSSHADSVNSYHLPGDNPSSGFSRANRNDEALINVNDDEQILFHNEELFEIDDHGDIHELPSKTRGQKESINLSQKTRLDLRSIASGPNDEKYQDVEPGRGESLSNLNRNDESQRFENNGYQNENLELLPVDVINQNESETSENASNFSVVAPQNRRAKAKKIIGPDRSTEIASKDLRKMISDYRSNMIIQSNLRARTKEKTASKNNAYYYIFGTGINKIGENTELSKFASPLTNFSGQLLEENILSHLGISFPESAKKRGYSNFEMDERISRKRPRKLDIEQGRHLDNDISDVFSQNNSEYDKSIELGREAASALRDHPSSSMMPWNISASIHSRPGSSIQRLGSRLTPASPLLGRGGSILPSDLERLLNEQDDMVIYEPKEDEYGLTHQSGLGNDNVVTEISTTQKKPAFSSYHTSQPWEQSHVKNDSNATTTGTSLKSIDRIAAVPQWVHEALNRESIAFFDFLRDKIIDEASSQSIDEINNHLNSNKNQVSFTRLIEPGKNSDVVAAQAFYHVLSLANKNVIRVEQTQENRLIDSDIDRDILISII